MTAGDIDLDTPHGGEEEVHNMLQKHEGMWMGQLEENSFTKMRIGLAPDSKPFKNSLYRAGPKTRELERAELDKQLKAVII